MQYLEFIQHSSMKNLFPDDPPLQHTRGGAGAGAGAGVKHDPSDTRFLRAPLSKKGLYFAFPYPEKRTRARKLSTRRVPCATSNSGKRTPASENRTLPMAGSCSLRTRREREMSIAAGTAPRGGPDGSWRCSARGLARLSCRVSGACRGPTRGRGWRRAARSQLGAPRLCGEAECPAFKAADPWQRPDSP